VSQYGPLAFDDFWRDSDDACMRCGTVGVLYQRGTYIGQGTYVRCTEYRSITYFAWYDLR